LNVAIRLMMVFSLFYMKFYLLKSEAFKINRKLSIMCAEG